MYIENHPNISTDKLPLSLQTRLILEDSVAMFINAFLEKNARGTPLNQTLNAGEREVSREIFIHGAIMNIQVALKRAEQLSAMSLLVKSPDYIFAVMVTKRFNGAINP